MTEVRRVTRPDRRRFLLGSATGIASYTLGLSPTLSQPSHSTARILVTHFETGVKITDKADDLRVRLSEQFETYGDPPARSGWG